MRLLCATVAVLLSSAAWAQSPAAGLTPEMRRCSELRTTQACGVSRRELKEARRQFDRGLQLRKSGKAEQAFDAISTASRLVPKDLEYLTAREVLRQQLVMSHVETANSLLMEHEPGRAGAELRQALTLDPSNGYAQQTLQQAVPQVRPNLANLRTEDDQSEVRVRPNPATATRDFHLRGDTRSVLQQIAAAFSVKVEFDESVQPRQLRFDIEGADFWTALRTVSTMTRTFWTPLSANQIYVAADTPTNRAQFERMSMRTFYLPDATSAAELNEIVSLFRTLFDIRFITQQPGQFTITVRAPRRLLDAATQLLQSLDASRPQVMLDFQVMQVSRTLLRAIGVDMPLQWQAFNLTSSALAALKNPNVQDLINQLIATGGINQANTTAVSALLAQLQSQQNSIFKNPFATFGGGNTRFAIPWPATNVNFSRNESQVVSLEKLTVHAAQGNAATIRIGDRYPILNATFAPIFNSSSISKVIQNNSFQAPFPSFTYEDLGITVKATPQVHADNISLDMNMEIRALGGTSLNGVPVISNRQYTGGISVKDGETAIIAGTLDSSEQNTLSGLPGLSRIPALGLAVSSRNKQTTQSELLVLVTPHLVRLPMATAQAIVVPTTD